MKGESVKTRAITAVACTLFAFIIAGCSDKSRMRFYIQSIYQEASSKNYVEADLIGSKTDPCNIVQEYVSVTVKCEAPGTVGPKYGVIVKSYYLDYYYFDPADGQYKGPIGMLNFSAGNMGVRVDPKSTAVITVPVAQFAVKAWANKVGCTGLGAYSGSAVRVDRMVARITLNGEDLTGKTVSAEGTVLIYLYDYGPGPQTGQWCLGMTPYDYLSWFCL